MTPSPEQVELIEAYLANELSSADMQTFEQDTAADPDLQAEVDTYRQLREGLKALAIEQRLQRARQQVQVKSEKIDQLVDSQTAVEKLTLKNRQIGTSWTRWAAAASVVFGLSLYVYQQQLPDLMYADVATADQLTKSLPTDLPPLDRQRVREAIEQYKAGQYDRVIEQLKLPAADQRTASYQQYYLGLSYLAKKQPSEAIALLRAALTTPSVQLHQKASWFLALAYLKNKEKARAMPIIKRIQANSSHPYRQMAEDLYQKIR